MWKNFFKRLMNNKGEAGPTDLAIMKIEGDASKGISNWTEVFPEDVRMIEAKDAPGTKVVNPILEKYKTPGELIKGVSEMNELIGRKGVILPKEGDVKDWDRFYNEIGRPETPEKYKFTEVKDLHPGVKVTPEATIGWAKVAHSFGMPQAMADNVNQWYLKVMDSTMKNLEAAGLKARQDGETSLRAQWKENYDTNFKAAQQAIKSFGNDSVLNKLGNLASDPEIVAMFYNIGKKITPDTTNAGGTGGGTGGEVKNVEQAKARLEEIKSMFSDPKSPLMDANHKDHEKVVKERMDLYEQIEAAKQKA